MTTKQITKNTETTDDGKLENDKTDELPDWNELNNRFWYSFTSNRFDDILLFSLILPAIIINFVSDPPDPQNATLMAEVFYFSVIMSSLLLGNLINKIKKSTIIFFTLFLVPVVNNVLVWILIGSLVKHLKDVGIRKYLP